MDLDGADGAGGGPSLQDLLRFVRGLRTPATPPLDPIEQIQAALAQDTRLTGRRLMDVLPLGGPATRAQFTAARRVVNGQDCAALIADYAMRFQDALLAGGCA